MATAQAAPEPQLGFPTKGSLRRFPFPRLIREIARANLTGSLYLLSAQTKKVVFFEAGQPVFVRSNVLSECLGQVLAQEGLITQEQCEQTLEAIRRTGKKQGELLVEMGILSEGNLRYGLQAQLRAKLFDIFSWEDGRYQFKPDTIETTAGVRLDTSAEGVILAAIQDRYPEERARAALRDNGGQYPTLRGSPSDFATELGLELSLEEAFFVAGLDGSRTLDDVLQHGGDPPVPSPAALLYGLVQAGAIVLVDEAQPPRGAPARPSFVGGDGLDEAFAPGFEAQDVVTEYEDTPLPGELPKVRALLGDHEAEFAGVEDEEQPSIGPTLHSVAAARPKPELPEALVAAEPDGVEETFEDAIDFGEDESFDGILAASEPHEPPANNLGAAPAAAAASESAAARPSVTPPLTPSRPRPSEPAPQPPSATAMDFSSPGAAFFDVQPADVDTVAELDQPGSGRPPRDGSRSDPDATVLDGAFAAPISTDSIGHDLLAVDELDDVSIGQDDLAGLEMDAEAFDDVELEPMELHVASDDLEVVSGAHDVVADELGLDADGIDADLAIDADLGFDPAAIDADLALDADEPIAAPISGDALLDFDDLDAVDLGGNAAAPARYGGSEATMEEDANPEMLGALCFNEAEAALAEGDHAGAVALLEEAYERGFDVAELHAMLAYARFEASGEDPDTAEHALELLDYAQTMDPSLDMVHAYRGAIYRALRQPQRAREALDRALELNPYCELAMQIMDTL